MPPDRINDSKQIVFTLVNAFPAKFGELMDSVNGAAKTNGLPDCSYEWTALELDRHRLTTTDARRGFAGNLLQTWLPALIACGLHPTRFTPISQTEFMTVDTVVGRVDPSSPSNGASFDWDLFILEVTFCVTKVLEELVKEVEKVKEDKVYNQLCRDLRDGLQWNGAKQLIESLLWTLAQDPERLPDEVVAAWESSSRGRVEAWNGVNQENLSEPRQLATAKFFAETVQNPGKGLSYFGDDAKKAWTDYIQTSINRFMKNQNKLGLTTRSAGTQGEMSYDDNRSGRDHSAVDYGSGSFVEQPEADSRGGRLARIGGSGTEGGSQSADSEIEFRSPAAAEHAHFLESDKLGKLPAFTRNKYKEACDQTFQFLMDSLSKVVVIPDGIERNVSSVNAALWLKRVFDPEGSLFADSVGPVTGKRNSNAASYQRLHLIVQPHVKGRLSDDNLRQQAQRVRTAVEKKAVDRDSGLNGFPDEKVLS